MTMEDAVESLASDSAEAKKWVGVYIGILAGLLAIGNVGGGNASKDAMRANIDASDSWAFYQSKHIRSQMLTISADQIELTLETSPDLPAATVKRLRATVDSYRDHASKLNTDPSGQEGMKELFARAKRLENDRDVALRRDPYFDWSQALLQIAIVLASVHLIVGTRWVFRLSALLALFGLALMLNGFCSVVNLALSDAVLPATCPLA
jgi:hypothetical protein